jgi:undecaprenyl-diphosphatase
MHEIVILIAKYFLVLPLLIALVIWLKLDRQAKKEFVILAVVGGLVTVILAELGSKLFYDPRPFVSGHFTPYFAHGNDNGFPSDHTLLSSFIALVVLKFNRQWGLIALVIAVMIGLARVIAGVHHIADIAGSILFSALGVMLVSAALSKFRKTEK